ncbi:MAG: FtsW/RodA/SpoVE family cell cycle protein [Chloroflexi bacterium]|nr:FtsW/RodA/SpoVE family cell cycle protein [Chloroflexota bacterium]
MIVRARPVFRGTELGHLVFVALLVGLGFAAVVGSELEQLTPLVLVVPAAFVGIAVALHLFLVITGFRGDQLLLPLALALTAIGLVFVERLGPPHLLLQQVTWALVAAGAFVATILLPRDLSVLSRYKYTWAIAGLALLASPLLPVIGREVNGARIWVGFGDLFSFQPAEAVKVVLPIFFAAYLEEHRELIATPPRRVGPIPIPPLPYLAPIVLMWALAMGVMILQKDLGATLIFFGIFLAMLYLATGRAAYSIAGVLMLVAGGYAASRLFDHVNARIVVWLAPFADELRFGAGYQLVQGLFALGNAGLLGAGLGNGMPERIPVVWSDFVFAAFTEEVGFVGALALLALYLIFVFRGMTIALRAPTPFLQLLAGGLSFALAFQTLVIVGGNAKLIPLTGVTLPFLSYGGSSLVTNFVIVALLLRVSDITMRVRGG